MNSILKHVIRIISQTTETQQSATLIIGLAICYCLTVKRLNDRDDDSSASGTQDLTTVVDSSIITNSETIHSKHDNNLPSTSNYTAPTINQSELRNVQTNLNDENEDEANVSQPLINNDGEPNSRLSKLIAIKTLVDELIAEETQALNSNTRTKKTNDNSSGPYCKSFFADRQAPCEIFLPNQSTVTNKLNASDNEIINFSHPSVVKTEINEKLIDHIDNSTISVNPEINEKLCDQRTFESWNTSPIVEFRPTIKHRVIDEPYAPINNFVTDRKKKSVFFTDNFVPSSYQQNPFEAFARRQLTTERDEQLQLVTLNESNDTTPPKHNIYCESFAPTRNLVTNNKFVKKSKNFTDNFVPLSSSCQQSPFEAFARRQLATERDEQLQLVTSNESNDTSPLKHKTYSESFAPIWNLETNNKFVNKSVNFTDKFEPFHQQNPIEALSNGKLATKRNVATLELIDASPLTHNIYSESVAPIRNSTTDNKFVKKSVQFSDEPLSTIHQQSAIEPLPNRELATRKEYLPNSHQSLNYLLDRNQKRQIPSLSKIKKFNESLSPISTKNFTDNSAYKRNDLNVEDFKLSNSQHCKYIQNSTKLTDEYQSNSSENVHKLHNVPRVTSFLVGNSENSYYPGSRSYLDKIIESDEILRENPISKEITDLNCSLNGANQRKQEINHRITKKNSNFSNNFPKQSFDHLDGLENIDKTEQFVLNIADNRKITNNLRSFSQNSNNLINKKYIPSINENNDIFAKQSTLDSQYDEADTVTRSVPKVTVNSSKITQNSSNLCDQQYDSRELIEKSEKYSLDEQKHLAKIIEFDEEQRKDYCKNYFLKIKSKNSTEFFDNRTIGLKTNIHKSKTICLQQSFDKTVIDCSNLPKTSKTNEAKSQEPIISLIENNFKDSQNDHHTEFITCYNVKKDTEPVSTVVSTLPPKHRYKALRTFLNKMLNKSKTKIHCAKCTKKCSGEVLRVTDKYFHKTCFQCTTCSKSLAAGGFFSKDNAYYCTADYQKLYGTKCASCNLYVEGEVVSTMGNTYHQKCFTCSRCKLPFQSGSKVTNTGKEVLCEKCVVIPINKIQQSSPSHNNHHSNHHNNHQQPQQQQQNSPIKEIARSPTRATAQQHNQNDSQNRKTASTTADYDPNECAGCGEQLKEGQALIALDRQWHIWCFRCKNCSAVLNGEYMGKDGVPYCEKCYQKSFGVKCAYCNRFISGKVLQAGDNHHFHPTCARCTKCGDPFGDGEEMYLQGSAIWHPRCGPGPSAELGGGTILNGSSVSGGGGGVIVSGGGIGAASNGHLTDTDCDRLSNSAMSEMQFSLRSRTPSINGSIYSPYSSRKISQGYRTVSPGLVLREYGRQGYGYDDISRIYTYSYLTDEPHYLRKPIDPYDKTPVSPHFHRPSGFGGGGGGGGGGSRPSSRPHSRNKSAMKVLVDSIRTETPRPKSPAMNNEEPIELSHYPGAKKPPLGEKPKIERDDFPAPPYPYTDPERRRRYSDSYKGVPVSDDEDEVDDATAKNGETKNEQLLRKEEEELLKINSGMGAVILKDIKEHAKYRKWKQQHMDPRNASRTPSASKEPVYRLRYESPVGASPSRHLDHQKPFYEDEQFDRSTSYRGSVGRSIGNAPSYNAIHSYRSPPKPGYGLKTSTLPIGYRNGYSSDFSFGGLGDKTHSTEFSCGKSDVSVDSITEGDRQALMADLPASSTYSGVLSYHYPQAGLIRRSLPNMAHSMLVHEPAKIYPYHLLLITNYRLPADVDRCNLERHLSDVEFEAILQCTRSEFYRMPQWRRNEIKRRARLF